MASFMYRATAQLMRHNVAEPMTEDRDPSIDDPAECPRARLPPAVEDLADELRAGGQPDDEAFDRFLPVRLRMVSGMFWTPLAVAARTATWFAELGVVTVVDIGSGVGKFCVAAALGGGCRFTGLEQRPRLVTAAGRLARLFRVDDRVRFVAGILDPSTVPVADAYYLYNPFGENRFGPEAHLDEDVELGDERYRRDIAAVEHLLDRAPTGTYVVTYNGFGGRVPDGYIQIRVDRTLPNMLRMWQKSS
jgi:predicted RNA methylase